MKKVLLIGAGADSIEHGDELDAAAFQVASVLKEQGWETILIDDNPFSFTLDCPDAIDHACIKSLTVENVVATIKQYRPDAILPTLGGRRAFELIQAVSETGILQADDIELLGVPEATIRQINNPMLLGKTLHNLNVPTKAISKVDNYVDALEMVQRVGYPIIVRSVLPKGAGWRSLVHDQDELKRAVATGLRQSRSGQITVQQSLAGFKEIEIVVLRDGFGTMMQLACVEDIDPIGIHAGDSIAVLPSQTLLDREIQDMRDTAFAITRKLRIVGVNHVQFALDQANGKFYVIKNNPYFDRLTAFAATATGYALQVVCGELYAGKTLRDIHLDHGYYKHAAVTEPVMDHVAVRMPVWPFAELPDADRQLGTRKKSTGTMIGVGRSLTEAMFKAISDFPRIEQDSRLAKQDQLSDDELVQLLIHPHAGRLFTLLAALRRGYTDDELTELTKIDAYYFACLRQMQVIEDALKGHPGDTELLVKAKYCGMSDESIAKIWQWPTTKVVAMRDEHVIHRTFKELEPSAGEFDQHTNVFYSTYEMEDEANPSPSPTAVVVGTGPLRLGNGTSCDYFVANTLRELRDHGYQTVIINDNPSSVTLAPMLARKRYLEPLQSENIRAVLDVEHPKVVLIPASRHELIDQLGPIAKNIQIAEIPEDQRPTSLTVGEPLDSFNALFDGQLIYPLGITADLQSTDDLSYQPTAQRFPARLTPHDFALLEKQGGQAISEQNAPGLYQVVFVHRFDGTFKQLLVQHMPLPEIAFLSKVLKLNLPGITVRMALGRLDGDALNEALVPKGETKMAVYRAVFPFKSLHLVHEKPTINRVLGGQMQFLSNDDFE